jgi:hypothetical protein
MLNLVKTPETTLAESCEQKEKKPKKYKSKQLDDSLINLQSVQSREFECKICKKTYYSNYNLERHRSSCKGVVKILKHSKIKIIDDLELLSQNSIDSKKITIVINTSNINHGATINNINHGTINNIVNNIPTDDDVIDAKIKQAVDKIIYDSCKDPELYVLFESHWKKQKVLPLGYETDDHITNHTEIWSSGRKSFNVYLDGLFSNPLNQNIYQTDERKKTVKFISANGQIKEMGIKEVMEIETLNNIDRYNNYVKRTSSLVEPRYRKVVEQMQKEQDAYEDSIPNFDGFLKDTTSAVKNYSKASKKNIHAYEKANPTIIHGPIIPNSALPSTEMRINFF